MTTTRPYRTGLEHAEAIRRLREGAGAQWEASIVAAFLRLLDEYREARRVPASAPAGAGSASTA